MPGPSRLSSTGTARNLFTLGQLDDPGERPRLAIWRSHEVPWLDYGPGVPGYAEVPPPARNTCRALTFAVGERRAE